MSRYAALTRDQLAVVVPELLLIGHLIDRAGMAYVLTEVGPAEMNRIAIEEWQCASPVYTRRMQRALRFEGDDVITIFKGLQLDIGAPPQFMDFRYTVEDPQHGRFHLDHCGALLDVEPMGPEMVRGMCHDIEDPTFDATAVATNLRAQVRPVHRPPRVPADRTPHCEWTVTISADHEPAVPAPGLSVIAGTCAAGIELDRIDRADDGAGDYAGPLVSDLAFGSFSRSALIRIADEVALQQQLLHLSFARAATAALGERAEAVLRNELIGHAGLAAGRLAAALGLQPTPEDAARLLSLCPALNPAAYVIVEVEGARLEVKPSPAHHDGGWPTLIDPEHPEPLQAMVRALDPHFDVVMSGSPASWTAEIVVREEAAREHEAVAITKLSGGAAFTFESRRSLPLYVV